MNFKNVDMTGLTPEQQENARQMAEYTASPDFRSSATIVALAEKYVGQLIESDHRPAPVDAFKLALKYAEHVHTQGEKYLQDKFTDWLLQRLYAKQAEAADQDGSDEDIADLEAGDAVEIRPDADEAVTLDEAKADTERRVDAGEAVKPTHEQLAEKAAKTGG